ncbi:class I SAM-dependent methyltransferase [Sabulicella glaciei]|uniref:Methyltransferase domain-containing protein n=1 Tax=Sabulicella glaciei TaxID=2984948 RepID=A0ABT3NY02_9PROT|nr:methyltransferase domain-containing protein [Roseococcus sp. MDT2-1-1]MCW8087040.1 methyltransferase domain-containing protein [Roseococcus sp. MDT2-1-1]
MHDTAIAAGKAFFDAYMPEGGKRVLEIGSLDVNGSLRDVAPLGTDYVGADLGPGRGVDIVVPAGEDLPFPSDSFDACVSISCFEHDSVFWETICRIARVIRPGGLIYLDVPSNGPYHAYPRDIWRFYPDAGLALAEWARKEGFPLTLVESGTLRRRADLVGWNDFVAVLQKAPVTPPRRFMLEAFPDAMNVRRLGVEGLLNPEPKTEDQRLLDEVRHEAGRRGEEAARLSATLGEREAQIEACGAEVKALRDRATALTATLSDRDAEIRSLGQTLSRRAEETDSLRRTMEARERDLAVLKDRLAALEAALADAQKQLAEMSASTSWRVTAPLRAVSRRLKG